MKNKVGAIKYSTSRRRPDSLKEKRRSGGGEDKIIKKDKEIKVSRCWILCNHQSNICSSGGLLRDLRVKDRSLKKKTVKKVTPHSS